MRAAFDELVVSQQAHPAAARSLALMLRDEPGVRASVEERRRRWTEMLTPLVAPRLAGPANDPADDLPAAALAGAALACLDAAQQTWAKQTNADLSALLDRAMAAVAPLT